MTMLSDLAVEVAFDPTCFSTRDRIDIWRIARDEVFPLRHAEVHRDHAATLDDSFDKVAHLHTAALYEAAFALAARQSAVEMLGLPAQGPVDWPACGMCGVDPVAWRVWVEAMDGGEVHACGACADDGDALDSPAITWAQSTAIVPVSKPRVDPFDVADVPWVVAA